MVKMARLTRNRKYNQKYSSDMLPPPLELKVDDVKVLLELSIPPKLLSNGIRLVFKDCPMQK
jgi:hypothetical protein